MIDPFDIERNRELLKHAFTFLGVQRFVNECPEVATHMSIRNLNELGFGYIIDIIDFHGECRSDYDVNNIIEYTNKHKEDIIIKIISDGL